MTAEVSEAPSPAAQVAPPKNSFQRILGALFSPGETFADIARRPDVLVPLLVIVLIGYATTAMIMPRMDWDAVVTAQQDAMKAKNPNVSQEQLDRMARVGTAVGKVIAWSGPILGVAWYALVAGILLLAFRMMGGEGTYKQAFSATLYAWIPLVLNGILLAVIVMSKGKVDPTQFPTMLKSNLAFLSDMKDQPVQFALLSAIDFFTIWTVLLLTVGFSKLAKTTFARAAAIVVSLWIVVILIKTGFAAMGAAARART